MLPYTRIKATRQGNVAHALTTTSSWMIRILTAIVLMVSFAQLHAQDTIRATFGSQGATTADGRPSNGFYAFSLNDESSVQEASATGLISAGQQREGLTGLPVSALSAQQMPRLQSTYTPGSLTTDSMIGSLASPTKLFSNLNTPPVYQQEAGVIGTAGRMMAAPDNSFLPWYDKYYCWHSPVFYHEPLYFEQPNLERYGVGPYRVFQPFVSSAHFFGSIALIPYKTLTHHPHERVYTLGHQRPGNYVRRQGRVLIGQSAPGELFHYWHTDSGY